MTVVAAPKTRAEWRATLDSLPATPDHIPAFFLAHGQPMIIWPHSLSSARMQPIFSWGGRDGPLGQFLEDFGPVLLKKYEPKGIIVFSAHWETEGTRLVTDYGDENPLLMDYYDFHPELYKVKFQSRGDSTLTEKVVNAFKAVGIRARATPKTEPRGFDGRGFEGPGLDHGVFVPFIRMFGEVMPDDIPIVEVSIDTSLNPRQHWEMGSALRDLRKQGYLIISGGLPIHSFRNNAWDPERAGPLLHDFHNAIIQAVQIKDSTTRREALQALTRHRGFRAANPREEHFVPLYVAAGAGDAPTGEEKDGESIVLADIYGMSSFAFGV